MPSKRDKTQNTSGESSKQSGRSSPRPHRKERSRSPKRDTSERPDRKARRGSAEGRDASPRPRKTEQSDTKRETPTRRYRSTRPDDSPSPQEPSDSSVMAPATQWKVAPQPLAHSFSRTQIQNLPFYTPLSNQTSLNHSSIPNFQTSYLPPPVRIAGFMANGPITPPAISPNIVLQPHLPTQPQQCPCIVSPVPIRPVAPAHIVAPVHPVSHTNIVTETTYHTPPRVLSVPPAPCAVCTPVLSSSCDDLQFQYEKEARRYRTALNVHYTERQNLKDKNELLQRSMEELKELERYNYRKSPRVQRCGAHREPLISRVYESQGCSLELERAALENQKKSYEILALKQAMEFERKCEAVNRMEEQLHREAELLERTCALMKEADMVSDIPLQRYSGSPVEQVQWHVMNKEDEISKMRKGVDCSRVKNAGQTQVPGLAKLEVSKEDILHYIEARGLCPPADPTAPMPVVAQENETQLLLERTAAKVSEAASAAVAAARHAQLAVDKVEAFTKCAHSYIPPPRSRSISPQLSDGEGAMSKRRQQRSYQRTPIKDHTTSNCGYDKYECSPRMHGERWSKVACTPNQSIGGHKSDFHGKRNTNVSYKNDSWPQSCAADGCQAYGREDISSENTRPPAKPVSRRPKERTPTHHRDYYSTMDAMDTDSSRLGRDPVRSEIRETAPLPGRIATPPRRSHSSPKKRRPPDLPETVSVSPRTTEKKSLSNSTASVPKRPIQKDTIPSCSHESRINAPTRDGSGVSRTIPHRSTVLCAGKEYAIGSRGGAAANVHVGATGLTVEVSNAKKNGSRSKEIDQSCDAGCSQETSVFESDYSRASTSSVSLRERERQLHQKIQREKEEAAQEREILEVERKILEMESKLTDVLSERGGITVPRQNQLLAGEDWKIIRPFEEGAHPQLTRALASIEIAGVSELLPSDLHIQISNEETDYKRCNEYIAVLCQKLQVASVLLTRSSEALVFSMKGVNPPLIICLAVDGPRRSLVLYSVISRLRSEPSTQKCCDAVDAGAHTAGGTLGITRGGKLYLSVSINLTTCGRSCLEDTFPSFSDCVLKWRDFVSSKCMGRSHTLLHDSITA